MVFGITTRRLFYGKEVNTFRSDVGDCVDSISCKGESTVYSTSTRLDRASTESFFVDYGYGKVK
jgi:hypothetical protein